MPRVIAFANQKGGVAKTTTTLNLGVAFKEKGLRVLLVDLDPQGNLTMSQGLNPDVIERSMFDVLVHRLPIEEIIDEAEVDVAVSSIDLAGAELALSSMIGRERALEKALVSVKESYDFILIDTPPSLGLLTINAFVASDGVIVPVQCEYLSLRGLVQLENTLTMIRENLNPGVEIEGILPTMYDKRLLHSKEAVEILKENFGDLVFKTRIRKTIRYAEAPVKGQSVLAYDPTATRPSCTATSRRRCSMARKRASMREGPLAELFRATEAAQRQAEEAARQGSAAPEEPQEGTVEHVPTWEDTSARRDARRRAAARVAPAPEPPDARRAAPVQPEIPVSQPAPPPPPAPAVPEPRASGARALARAEHAPGAATSSRCPSPHRGSTACRAATRPPTSR